MESDERVPLETESFLRQQARELLEATHEMKIPPPVSGVFWLYQDGLVVYVGDADDVAKRILQIDRSTYDRVQFVSVPEKPDFLRKDVRRGFIHFFRPSRNEKLPAENRISDYYLGLVDEYMIPLDSPRRKR